MVRAKANGRMRSANMGEIIRSFSRMFERVWSENALRTAWYRKADIAGTLISNTTAEFLNMPLWWQIRKITSQRIELTMTIGFRALDAVENSVFMVLWSGLRRIELG
jgi:hypothetical protein